jgi:hypothetical protein
MQYSKLKAIDVVGNMSLPKRPLTFDRIQKGRFDSANDFLQSLYNILSCCLS